MSPEFYAIIGVGVSLAGFMLGLFLFFNSQIDRRFGQVDARFDQLDARFDRLEDRVGRLEDRVDRLEDTFIQRMNRLEDKIDRLIEQTHSLDIRVSKLEWLAEAWGEFRREQTTQLESGDPG